MATIHSQLTEHDKQYLVSCIQDKRMTMKQTLSASANFFGTRLTLTIGALRRVLREAHIDISKNRLDLQRMNEDVMHMGDVGWVMAMGRRKHQFTYHYMHNLAIYADEKLVKDHRGGAPTGAMVTSSNCSEFFQRWSSSVVNGDNRAELYKWVSSMFEVDIVSCPGKVSKLLKRIRSGRKKNNINGRFVTANDKTPQALVGSYEDPNTPFTWVYLSLKFPCYTRKEMHDILAIQSDRYADKMGDIEPPLIDDTDLMILHAHYVTLHNFIDICYLLRIYDLSDRPEHSEQYLTLKMYSIQKAHNEEITDIPEYHNI